MEHEHKFVELGFTYIQDTRDCTHWFYQCEECSTLKYEYHGYTEDSDITYYQNGKVIKQEPLPPDRF